MRRRVLTVISFAFVGIVLSFGSGWACVLWRVFIAKQYLGADEGRSEQGGWPLPVPADWPQPYALQVTRGWGYERHFASGTWTSPFRIDPASVRVGSEPTTGGFIVEFSEAGPPVTFCQMFRRRSGWPLRCLQTSWTNDGGLSMRSGSAPSSVPDTLGHGWTTRMYYERGLPWPTQVRHPNGSVGHFNLPLRPLWFGFIVNTAFWGAAAWLAWRGVAAVRRRRRYGAGCCTQCGYPIGVSSVCTECGRPVRRHSGDTLAG